MKWTTATRLYCSECPTLDLRVREHRVFANEQQYNLAVTASVSDVVRRCVLASATHCGTAVYRPLVEDQGIFPLTTTSRSWSYVRVWHAVVWPEGRRASLTLQIVVSAMVMLWVDLTSGPCRVT